jgi:hypothetical protein
MIEYIIPHHSGVLGGAGFESVNQYHKEKWNFKSSLGYYAGYPYFMERDGTIIQARVDGEWGAHTKGFNNQIAICLDGDFSQEMPTDAQIASLRAFLKEKVKQYDIDPANIRPHRAMPGNNTECYGSNLPDDWARNLLFETMAERYAGRLIKNADNPKVYYSNGEQIAHIENETKFYFGLEAKFWPGFGDVETIEEPIKEDITF